MPFGGNDWLALTSEAVLEPELPICDPHHHLWDRRLARVPYQRYQLDELAADIQSGHNVRSTVFIKCRSVPELTIVLNHVGGLVRTGPYADRNDEIMENWRKDIAAVAARPNVVVKLGGLGMVRCGFDWHTRDKPIGSEELAGAMAPFLSYCIEKFTPERSMFESNFPVDKVSFSYGVMWNAFKRFSRNYSTSERAAMFPRHGREGVSHMNETEQT